ncbi:MAG TPA: hypothetical protein DD490_25635 [Acidobacteria bacterium]|nr:hypothetical protein [Acidobacteriota bacterium]
MRIKPALSLLALLLAGGSPCLAQQETGPAAHNAVFFELLGNGGVYSFNYERMLTESLGLRVGVAAWNSPILWDGGGRPDRYATVPVTLSYLLGRGERKLELGGGVTFGQGTLDRSSDQRRDFSFRSVTAIVGYRSQPKGRGYLFRVGATPFYSFDDGEEAYPDPGLTFSAGVSFGYRL